MTGFLGKAPLTSDIALFLEIAIVIALLLGRFRFARKKKFAAHGYVMAFAVCLHVISVLLVMIPSLAVSLDLLFTDFFSPAILITWIHVPLGTLTLILGAYLIIEWRFRPVSATCQRRAKLMRPLWLLWVFTLILGLIIYATIAFA
jgi:uncharacterized membrane protein YozB (DUF420 family)